MATKPETALLDADFMSKLNRLELVSKKIFAGKMRGERRSKRRGESVEFADFRNYTVGDDLRFLDWNIYARLDRLFLKLFLEEEDLLVSVIFDRPRAWTTAIRTRECTRDRWQPPSPTSAWSIRTASVSTRTPTASSTR